MEFKPRKIDESVNVSSTNFFKESMELLLGTIIALAALFIIIHLLISLFIPYFPSKYEEIIWKTMSHDSAFKNATKPEHIKKQEYLQSLLNKIPASVKPEGYEFEVLLMEEKAPNAFAVPGGKILFTTGLLEKLKTENAIVFVLGHEIGHFRNKDHLRMLGSGLASSVVMLLITGGQADISNFVGSISSLVNNAHSRSREKAADEWGIETLNQTYGHTGGATEFFEVMQDMRTEYMVEGYLSTHPLSTDRIEKIKDIINAKGYKQSPALIPKR